MKRSESYNTKQKEILLDLVKKHNREFNVKDICDEVGDSIGRTTIYRLVEKLVQDGVLKKILKNDNTTYYQYLEKCDKENHFYLRCDNCGNMIHVDCDCIEELSNHLFKEHNFITNKKNVVISGLCNNCRRKLN